MTSDDGPASGEDCAVAGSPDPATRGTEGLRNAGDLRSGPVAGSGDPATAQLPPLADATTPTAPGDRTETAMTIQASPFVTVSTFEPADGLASAAPRRTFVAS